MGANARGHIQQVISHSMLNIRVLKRVVVNHHHFIVVAFGYREPFVIPVHLMRAKITKRAVGTHFRDRSQEGFSGGLSLQGNHQQFIVAMGVGEFDAAVHVEFQRG